MSTSTSEAESLAQTNRKYYDLASASEETLRAPWITHLQATISAFLLDPASSPWLGLSASSVEPLGKMLDFACGEGIASRSLKPHFKSCVGVDVSGGMVAKYNATAARLGLGAEEMLGVRGDLVADSGEVTDPPLPEDRLWGFDLVAICMALHHMEDIQRTITKLAERLRPGGTLLVIDWAHMNGTTPAQQEFMEDLKSGKIRIEGVELHGHGHHHHQHHSKQDTDQSNDPKEPWKPHPASHTISHDSFTEKQILELFENAGCTEGRFKLAEELLNVPGSRVGKMQLFWARATKA